MALLLLHQIIAICIFIFILKGLFMAMPRSISSYFCFTCNFFCFTRFCRISLFSPVSFVWNVYFSHSIHKECDVCVFSGVIGICCRQWLNTLNYIKVMQMQRENKIIVRNQYVCKWVKRKQQRIKYEYNFHCHTE